MLELNHLKYIYEVARTKSFSKAARNLRISQPGISRTIRESEERLGIRIFDRTRRKVELTQSGRAILEKCENIFNEVRNLEELLESDARELKGILKLAASDNLCNYILPELLYRFWQEHTKILIKLHSGTSKTIEQELLQDRAEIGLFYTNLTNPDLELTKLAEIEFIVVCSKDNDLILSSRNKTEALQKAFYIGSKPEEYQAPNPALKLLSSLGIRPKQYFEINNHEAQKKMAMQPWGYTVVPRHAVLNELKAGSLVEVRLARKMHWPLYYAKRKGRTLSRTAQAFTETLLQKLRTK